jgi:hypothetical protein
MVDFALNTCTLTRYVRSGLAEHPLSARPKRVLTILTNDMRSPGSLDSDCPLKELGVSFGASLTDIILAPLQLLIGPL